MNNIIIHVSEVDISTETGVGRVEFYWKKAFEDAKYTFIHIGPNEVGKLQHNYQFPKKAYNYYKKLNIIPKAFIVHEPASGYFVNRGIPCFVESHGVESRYWEAQLKGTVPPSMNEPISWKKKFLFPLWRLHGCNKGLKKADKLLLINSDDKNYVLAKYKRQDHDILLFKNGVNKFTSINTNRSLRFTVLFNGGWLERKGIRTLIEASELLFKEGLSIDYLLIGTGKDIDTVLTDWPQFLRPFVSVVPRFPEEDEAIYLESSSLYILPSFFEGQPLSLLQAMAASRCCITTNCCGQKDIIKNGETGFLFEPGDAVELSNLIRTCYNNDNLVQEVGRNACKYTQLLTWEAVSKEVVDFISKHT